MQPNLLIIGAPRSQLRHGLFSGSNTYLQLALDGPHVSIGTRLTPDFLPLDGGGTV